MKTVKYVMTNGLLATGNGLSYQRMAKVVFAIKEDDSVHVTVEDALNGNTMSFCGKKIITRDELRAMPENPYDDMVFNRAAFELMGLSI
jgi:hypothetical protein